MELPLNISIVLNIKDKKNIMDLVVPFVIYGWCVNIHMPLCLGLKTILIPTADLEKIAKQIYEYKTKSYN